jgi:cobalt-zinc-cadmium efflux system membrane fusion protein
MCPEHQVPEAEDALCLSDHLSELRPGAGMLVRLASEQVGARAGIHTTTPEAAQLSEPLEVPARLTFARERLATLTPLASGTVHQVHVRPGTRVEKGDLLLEISTPDIARLHAGYSAARAQHEQNTTALEREEDLRTRGISAQEEVQRARATWSASRSEVEQYRRELKSFGLDAQDMGSSDLVPLRAPFAGVVTRLETSKGEGVSASSSLLTLADPDILWLELSIPALHAPSVVPHTPVQVTFDGVDSAPLETELFHVDPALNPQSRTLRALAQIPNPEGRLKAGMFTNATILRSGSSTGVSLPADAVQHIDGHSYIFIQREPDLFELRRVTTSALHEGRVGISAGIDPAHGSELRVVSARGFALKSEVLRARLGASCADH